MRSVPLDEVGEHGERERSHRDTALKPGRKYTYRVTAVDGAGNKSAFGATAWATASR